MKPLTGKKVLAIAGGAFGVIFAVNVAFSIQAVRTFPGLEVDNSFVASQGFDDRRDAQEALGWELDAHVANGELTLRFTDGNGEPVEVAALEATLGRATHVREDMEPEFTYQAGTFRAPVDLAPGNWNIRLIATAPDGTPFEQRVVLHVRES